VTNRSVHDQSLAELLGDLAGSIPNLVRDELELLRRQLGFAISRLQAASALLVVATALTMATVILMMVAAVGGLTIYIISVGLEPAAAVSLAALAVAVLSGATAAILIIGARGEFRRAQTVIGQSVEAVTGSRSEGTAHDV
jgi:ABC-type bacteriocin/lantibiotic exporter with double-glycine peptidase domain